MSLAFKKREDHQKWCECYTILPLAVSRLVMEEERKLAKSGDPKLRELAILLYKLHRSFSHGLHKGMDRIEFEWGGEK